MDSDSDENDFNPDFNFDFEPSDTLNSKSHERVSTLNEFVPSTLDQIIANVRSKKKRSSSAKTKAQAKKRKSNEETGTVKPRPLSKVGVDEDESNEEMEIEDDSEEGHESASEADETEEEDERGDDGDDDDDDDNEDEEEENSSSEPEVADKISVKQTSLKAIRRSIPFEEDPEAEKFKFTDDITEFDEKKSFLDFKLSRVVLKGLADLGFVRPTPVQSACIPLAMASRDICACARTGSGKTAAFLIPLLERLIRHGRPTRPMTRALVLSPTRELALQIYEVAQKLVRRCSQAIFVQLSAGGIDARRQESALRKCPDVVVATPGRLIDHLCNTPSFNLRDIQVLVLDEADKMLDDNFAEQLKEILRQCSPTRQTLLFSATMTETVKDLASVSLRSPARVFVNENTDVALRLQQEFVRVRPNQEKSREAMILALVCRHFARRTIVFAPTKRYCHRLRILLALSGIVADELHGNLRQPERLEALEKFAKGETAVLVATDLAARGLDVEGVQTVLNVCLPATLKQYVHRVGRTARAGKSGLAVSLAGESERRLLKAIVKRAPLPVKARLIPSSVLERYQQKTAELEVELEEVVKAEAVARQERDAAQALAQAEKALAQKAEKRSGREGGNQRVDWFKEQKAALKKAKHAVKKSAKHRKFSQKRRDDDSD